MEWYGKRTVKRVLLFREVVWFKSDFEFVSWLYSLLGFGVVGTFDMAILGFVNPLAEIKAGLPSFLLSKATANTLAESYFRRPRANRRLNHENAKRRTYSRLFGHSLAANLLYS